MVALRLECVDRNHHYEQSKSCYQVALRLECVDRNIGQIVACVKFAVVALRLECVDRNFGTPCLRSVAGKSHSAWSAWIEI